VKKNSRKQRRQRSDDRGVVFITAIFSLLLVSLLGASLIMLAHTSLNVSENDRELTEAFYIAEAGLEHGYALIAALPSAATFTQVLQYGDGQSNTWDELSTQPTAPIADPNPTVSPGQTPGPTATGGAAFATGRYWVKVSNDQSEAVTPNVDHNNVIVLTSLARARNGATATLELIIRRNVLPAVLVDGNLRISSAAQITGIGGTVHVNGNLAITSSPCASQSFDATGAILNSGSPTQCPSGAAVLNTSRPVVTVPNIDPSGLKPYADYVLSDDGNIYTASGTFISGSPYAGFAWDGGNDHWKLGSPPTANKTYFAEGCSILIDYTFGSPGSPLRVTFIADGYIGSSTEFHQQPNLVLDNQAFTLVAGTDLGLSSAATLGDASNPGMVYARHQFRVSSAVTIHGQLVGKNLADTTSPPSDTLNPIMREPGNYLEISSSSIVTHDSPGSASLYRRSWREVRN
jgi:hypothetical protein